MHSNPKCRPHFTIFVVVIIHQFSSSFLYHHWSFCFLIWNWWQLLSGKIKNGLFYQRRLFQCSLLNPSTTSCPSASKWKNESDTSHSFLKNRFLTVHSHKLMMKQAQNHDDHGVPSNTTVKCQRFVCFFCFVYCRCCCHFLQKFTRNNGLIWEKVTYPEQRIS